jgi:peptide alpha-N-acetyltransferase
MRDISGFVETRYRLLQLRPNNRNNWVTWAVAYHLDGNHDMAVQIIKGFESTLVRAERLNTEVGCVGECI